MNHPIFKKGIFVGSIFGTIFGTLATNVYTKKHYTITPIQPHNNIRDIYNKMTNIERFE